MENKYRTEQHSFDVQIARIWNIEKAIILKEISGWCRINERKKNNEAYGFFWTYNSSNAYAKHFGYMSDKKVDRLIREMENDGIIFGHKFYSFRGNQTKSHTVNWELYDKMVFTGEYCSELATNFIEYLSSNLRNAVLENKESSLLKNEESSFPKNEQSYTTPSNNSFLSTPTKSIQEDEKSSSIPPPSEAPKSKTKKREPKGRTLFKTNFGGENGFEKFCAGFEGSDYVEMGANLRYYFEAVRDWSASSGAMKADWIATARNFMRGDIKNNKFVKNGTLTTTNNRPTVDVDLAKRATERFLAKRGVNI